VVNPDGRRRSVRGSTAKQPRASRATTRVTSPRPVVSRSRSDRGGRGRPSRTGPARSAVGTASAPVSSPVARGAGEPAHLVVLS
jgi:hypothetical protein